MTMSHRHLVSSLALLGAILVIGVPADAQWAFGYEFPFQSQIDKETIVLAEEMLRLSEEQTAGAEALLEAHQQRFNEHAAKYRLIADQFEEELQYLPVTSVKALKMELQQEEELEAAAEGQRALDQQFLDQLKAFLSEGQLEYWPQFQQKFNRLRWLDTGAYGEEEVDLIALVEEVAGRSHVESNEELQEALTAYGHAIDAALVDRTEFKIRTARRFYRDMKDRYVMYEDGTWTIGSGPPGTKEKFQRNRMRLKNVHARVRDVNRLFRQSIAAALPEELQESFREAYRSAALDELIDPSSLQGAGFLEAVLAMNDLAEEQREFVALTGLEHAGRAARLDRKVLKAEEELLDARFWPHSSRQQKQSSRQHKQELEQVLEEAVEERVVAEQEVIDRVWSVLSEEQRQDIRRPTIE